MYYDKLTHKSESACGLQFQLSCRKRRVYFARALAVTYTVNVVKSRKRCKM